MKSSYTPLLRSDKAGAPQRRMARSRYTRCLSEALEPRTLLSASPSSYSIQGVNPQVETYDSSGNLWVVNYDQNSGETLLEEIADQQVVNTIDISSTAPNSITAGPAGHMYVADGFNGIDDVNLSNGNIASYSFSNFDAVPNHLTVTANGDVWFTPQSELTDDNEVVTNVIGRWTPGASDADYYTLPASTSDSAAQAIAPAGNDAVWVGLSGLDDGTVNGANHIAMVSFSGGNYSSSVYAVNSGNAVSDANNRLLSVTSDGSGGVWYSLSNTAFTDPTSQRTQHGPDMLVHGVLSGGNLVQTGFVVPGASGSTPLNVQSLSTDAGGRIWFLEDEGTNLGYFDPSSSSITTVPFTLSGDQIPIQVAANPTTGEATAFLGSFSGTIDATFVQADVQTSTTITFSGSASNLSAQQGIAFNQVLATFTAPTLASGNYTATITWGDGTTSTVATSSLGNNMYAVVISGKSFAQQGTYAGSIAITDPSNSPVGSTLNFQSFISDVPLKVTSFAGVDVLAGITAAAGTFTDDPNLATSTWTATINWGDGTTSSAVIVRDPTQAGRYLIVGAHVYRKKGTYTLTLLVNTTEQNALVTKNSLTTTLTVR